MDQFELIHFYIEENVIIYLGSTTLADKKTFNIYCELMQKNSSFIINFIPYNRTFAEGYYQYNPKKMIFWNEGKSLYINISNKEVLSLLTPNQLLDLEKTNQKIKELDIQKIKALMKKS